MYTAAALELRDGDRARLEALTRASTVTAGLATRARIVLLAADGVANTDRRANGYLAAHGSQMAWPISGFGYRPP